MIGERKPKRGKESQNSAGRERADRERGENCGRFFFLLFFFFFSFFFFSPCSPPYFAFLRSASAYFRFFCENSDRMIGNVSMETVMCNQNTPLNP